MDKKSIARKIIEKLAPTAEEAVKLTGKERKAYLGALDTVHGSQAERAKALGFGDNAVYHGTGADFEKFDLRGKKAKGGKSYFVSDDPVVASQYAESYGKDGAPNVMPLRTKVRSTFDSSNPEHLEKMSAEIAKLTPDERVRHGYEFSPEQWSREVAGGDWFILEQPGMKKAMKRAGFDSSLVKEGEEVGNMAIFNNSDIRSTNAAFDPRFKDSGLILAANGSKPNMGLGQAAGQLKSAYNRVVQPVDEIRNRIIQKIAAATDISNGKETVSKGTREEILNLAAPDVMDAVPVGKIGKLMGAAPIVARIMSKEGKILGAAEKAAPVLGREVKAGESTAEALINAPRSIYGKTVVKDTAPKVTSGTLQIKDNILKRFLPKNPMGSGI